MNYQQDDDDDAIELIQSEIFKMFGQKEEEDDAIDFYALQKKMKKEMKAQK